jgi:hypothetical protein
MLFQMDGSPQPWTTGIHEVTKQAICAVILQHETASPADPECPTAWSGGSKASITMQKFHLTLAVIQNFKLTSYPLFQMAEKQFTAGQPNQDLLGTKRTEMCLRNHATSYKESIRSC